MALGSKKLSPTPSGEDAKGTELEKPIGGLRLKLSKGGDKYYTGEIDGVKIIIFKNKYKKNNDDFDLRIFKSN